MVFLILSHRFPYDPNSGKEKNLFWSEERVLNLVLKFVLDLLVFKLMIYCHDGAYGNLGFFWIKTHPDSSTGA